MESTLLCILLYREDVSLREFRKTVAFSRNPKSDYQLIRAAVSFHFDLTNEEFTNLLRTDRSRLRLMSSACDMRAVLLRTAEAAFAADKDFDTAMDFYRAYNEHFSRIKGWRRRNEVRELRVYERAKLWAEGNGNLHESWAWLREYIEPGDIWETYTKLAPTAIAALSGHNQAEKKRWVEVLPRAAGVHMPTTSQSRRGRELRRIGRVLRRLDRIGRVMRRLDQRLAKVERVAEGARSIAESTHRFLIIAALALGLVILLRLLRMG
jgi:hypothetical protein